VLQKSAKFYSVIGFLRFRLFLISGPFPAAESVGLTAPPLKPIQIGLLSEMIVFL
jgi:hypothetical protein